MDLKSCPAWIHHSVRDSRRSIRRQKFFLNANGQNLPQQSIPRHRIAPLADDGRGSKRLAATLNPRVLEPLVVRLVYRR